MAFLDSILQKKAERELNEKPEHIAEDIDYIKEWIKKEPHLNARLDDQWLLAFLRGSKFSLQKAKSKIDFSYTMRTLIPEYFSNRNPLAPEMQALLEKGLVLPLPKTDPAGSRLLYFRWADCDPNVFLLAQILKLFFMFFDILMNEDPHAAISGIKIVADYKTLNANYLLQLTPTYVQKIVSCLQKAYPIRLKGWYILNAPKMFETFYSVARMAIPEKFRNRIVVYSDSNFTKVFDILPQPYFPKEYQGTNGSMPELIAEWKEKVESYKDWFEEGEKHGTQESLRRGTPNASADLFGVEGTFRKLNVD